MYFAGQENGVAMGLSSLSYYTTDLEIEYAEGLFTRNRPVFLKYCRFVLEDRRTWEGDFMAVDVAVLKNRIRALLEIHNKETDPTIPALRKGQK